MIKYLFFDLDGTLTDPKEGITKSVAYALESFGQHVENPDDLLMFIGPPLKWSFMEYAGLSDGQADMAVEKYRERFKDTGIFENGVYEGIERMLDKLKKAGFKLVLATSKPIIFADRILKHYGIEKYFEAAFGSELDGTRTDKAEVIEYAMNRTGAEPENTIMVGDRSHDVIGANKNNIRTIGVLFGYGNREELLEAGAYRLAENVAELEDMLININNGV